MHPATSPGGTAYTLCVSVSVQHVGSHLVLPDLLPLPYCDPPKAAFHCRLEGVRGLRAVVHRPKLLPYRRSHGTEVKATTKMRLQDKSGFSVSKDLAARQVTGPRSQKVSVPATCLPRLYAWVSQTTPRHSAVVLAHPASMCLPQQRPLAAGVLVIIPGMCAGCSWRHSCIAEDHPTKDLWREGDTLLQSSCLPLRT